MIRLSVPEKSATVAAYRWPLEIVRCWFMGVNVLWRGYMKIGGCFVVGWCTMCWVNRRWPVSVWWVVQREVELWAYVRWGAVSVSVLWVVTLCRGRWSCAWGRKERNRAHWTPSPLGTATSSCQCHSSLNILILISHHSLHLMVMMVWPAPQCSDNAGREESSSWFHKPAIDRDLLFHI